MGDCCSKEEATPVERGAPANVRYCVTEDGRQRRCLLTRFIHSTSHSTNHHTNDSTNHYTQTQHTHTHHSTQVTDTNTLHSTQQ